MIAADPDARPIRAEDHDHRLQQFRTLDRQIVKAATSEVIAAVNRRRPERTDVGEPAVIRREGMKKTRHKPVRELIGQTRATVQKIKPCFMMSPLAVSQYLPSEMRFDVVIFDEASQVTPGDAINCIYRGKSLITAGDDRQLPPTSFFDRMTDTEDDTTDVADFQSVLELAKASGGFRNLGLRWHYRSQHENLIAFSNQKFYDGRLITYPGALSEGPDVGIELFHVAGTYRRGTSRDNLVEAEAVAQRVIHHLDTRPDRSLGVVSFSLTQADAIDAALRTVREQRPDLEEHFSADRLKGIFVKSLEQVQGDERDVMIFSVGYGPDENGKITAQFGALNKPKGWRRLNVAITRARQRVEIVTSLRAGDVPPSQNDSVQHLISYLDYAERGLPALALDLGSSGLGTESPLEDSILQAIRNMGYVAEPQVGAAGYRIDIGVRHPDHPGAFALGVECDGYMYHSSPAARDRDRLRGEVLAGLGWRLHRIWGTSWYRHREQELERLANVIRTAVETAPTGLLTAPDQWLEPTNIVFADPSSDGYSWTTPYTVATVRPLPRRTDPSSPDGFWDMIPGIQSVVEVEGPIHVDLLTQRLRVGWHIGRIGVRIRDNILLAIKRADVVQEGSFVTLPAQDPSRVRVPTTPDAIREVARIPDAELQSAIVHLLDGAGGAPINDLQVATARLFGWNRRGSDISDRLTANLRDLWRQGRLEYSDQTVRLKIQD